MIANQVRLASRDLAWSFHDAGRLSSWIAASPWLSGGGILPLRVAGPRHAEHTRREIDAAVRSADAGASDVQVREVVGAVSPNTAASVLRDVLEVDVKNATDRRSVEAVADILAARSFVIVVDATTWSDLEARQALEDLRTIGTATGKLAPRAALTSVLLHSGPLWAGGDELVCDVGGPSTAFLDCLGLGAPEGTVWNSYLHHRLAWETGGNLDRAYAWNDVVADRARRLGDDAGLEEALGALATEEWSTLAPEQRRAVLTVARGSHTEGRDRSMAELEHVRAMWRPGGPLRVVPWMARAILITEGTPPLRSRLRWCLVCSPLRRELLARCLDIEGQVRAAHGCDVAEPPEGAYDAWEAFQRSLPGSDARFYPPNSAARPDGPYSFVDFGGFLASVSLHEARLAACHKLRILRNYLAHGHYASWACVRELMEVQRILSA